MRTLDIAPNTPSRPIHGSARVARTGLGKRLVWLGVTLLALEIFYVIAGNLFLRFGLLPLVNGTPESVLMAYESAYTLWPGVAHVRGYRMRNQSRSIQWQLEVDDGDLTIDLAALFGKTFRATRARATGVAFRLRRKLDSAGAAEPRARALAPIEGFEDPPLRPVGPDEPPESDADYSSWTVHLDDIDALAREIWIDEIRTVGPARTRGGFFLKPERVIQVGPTTLDIEQGEIWIGEYAAAKPIDVHVESIVGAIDLQGPLDEGLREISGHAQINAHSPGIELVRLYLGDPPALRVADGSGSLHADVYLAHGVAMPPSTISVESPHLVLGAEKFTATLGYRAEVRVVAAEPEPIASGDLVIHEATIVRDGAEGASPRIENARAHFIGLPRDLVGPYAIERTELDVPAKLPDLRWILPAPEAGKDRPVELGGSAALRARVTVDSAMRAAGDVEAGAAGVDVKTPSFQARGRLSTRARFHDADPGTRSLALDPSFVLAEDVAITRAKRAHPGGTLRVDVTGGRLADGVPRDLALTLAAKVPDLRWLAWKNPEGGAPSLTARAADVSAKLSIPRPASLFDGTPEEAAMTGSISLRGSVDARFTEASLRGKVEASARIERLDLGRGVAHIRGLDVVSRDLAVDHGASRTRGWWGRFVVPRLDVEAETANVFAMHAEARCKDGAPFLAVLASEGTIPGFTGALFPMDELTASVELRLSREKLHLDLRARGSSANITARLHDVGPRMSGAVHVDTKLASLGVAFEKGQSEVKILAGEEWLNGRIAEVQEKERAEQAGAPTEARSTVRP
ncbi:MAG: hypothetical protein ACMG6S_01300 [Byssovorax sp.]